MDLFPSLSFGLLWVLYIKVGGLPRQKYSRICEFVTYDYYRTRFNIVLLFVEFFREVECLYLHTYEEDVHIIGIFLHSRIQLVLEPMYRCHP